MVALAVPGFGFVLPDLRVDPMKIGVQIPVKEITEESWEIEIQILAEEEKVKVKVKA